jgi:uncharacterized membrane protein YphA (DoxX/SURF4 family)
MTDLQAELCFAAGAMTGIVAPFLPDEKQVKRLLRVLTYLVLPAIVLTLLLLTFRLLHYDTATVTGMMKMSLHKWVIFFLAGVIIFWFATARVSGRTFPIFTSETGMLLLQVSTWLMAVNFLSAGLSKPFVYQANLDFFKLCGYSPAFMNFIIVVEIVGGLGLLFPRTRWIAAAVLMIEMWGATYTHYHNYFTRGLPDPFSNSMDSLKWQPFLILLLYLAISRRKKEPTNLLGISNHALSRVRLMRRSK